ncbi:hypothetical protein LK994_05135 [Ferruginibacter lapsinanis]|uniref:hypothetical protein n=1 Tax=Ferruginibacter lapsinanis TaxID=563172 RepID=UPI001E658DD2|nr:hypothetical protein [Ferruginibacter lapsinanis]UEG50858.1 hypothetical protein LK994_05135 [Ferruginibacter lapsinanis]
MHKPSILQELLSKFRSLYTNKALPKWFIRLNFLGLSAIVVWPLVFFASIFMFDNPKNFGLTFLLFLLIIAYPLLFIGNMMLSIRLFATQKTIAVLLPLISFGGFIYFIFKVFSN